MSGPVAVQPIPATFGLQDAFSMVAGIASDGAHTVCRGKHISEGVAGIFVSLDVGDRAVCTITSSDSPEHAVLAAIPFEITHGAAPDGSGVLAPLVPQVLCKGQGQN